MQRGLLLLRGLCACTVQWERGLTAPWLAFRAVGLTAAATFELCAAALGTAELFLATLNTYY